MGQKKSKKSTETTCAKNDKSSTSSSSSSETNGANNQVGYESKPSLKIVSLNIALYNAIKTHKKYSNSFS